ncbi:hypothetical protein FRC04_007044 [Tulasnella sp. 424]|nr:hypothetical protein FRC04_007044 [Tulasnella sp. 424]KAG8964885.1 hypothetical protein FRC05_003541 [Tulasnella sp. 425]
MSQLQNSQRSKSAPGLLASTTFDGDVPASLGQPHLISTPSSEGPQDAFNLEGAFFPRSNSYYALSSMNTSSSGDNWVYGSSTTVVASEAETNPNPSQQDRRSTMTATSSPNSTLSFPRTPIAPLNLLDDTTLRNRIEAEDRVRGLALSALEKVTEIGFGGRFDGPSYEHDHIFHSYDALHDSFCEKRRSATVPNLAAVAAGGKKKVTVGGVYDAHGAAAPTMDRKKSSGKVSLLFSPTEEEIDLFGKGVLDDDDEEDGKEKAVKEGDSWVTYMYTSAKQLWVRKSASESIPPPTTSI